MSASSVFSSGGGRKLRGIPGRALARARLYSADVALTRPTRCPATPRTPLPAPCTSGTERHRCLSRPNDDSKSADRRSPRCACRITAPPEPSRQPTDCTTRAPAPAICLDRHGRDPTAPPARSACRTWRTPLRRAVPAAPIASATPCADRRSSCGSSPASNGRDSRFLTTGRESHRRGVTKGAGGQGVDPRPPV